MKLNKIILKAVAAISLTLALTGCTDEFFDVNENPNSPSMSTPKLSLPVAQQELLALNARPMTYLGNYMMYNWSKPSNWQANIAETAYTVNANFYSGIFEGSYLDVFKNLVYMESYTDNTGVVDYSIYKGISTILKAYQYQYLVDLYGDVPYTEANQRGGNTTPKYDKAEDIYKDNINKLTEVVAALNNIPTNGEKPGSQDIIFKGDLTKWQQFANTIKLRYLVRLSNTGQDSYIKSEIAKILANGKGFITADVKGNPGYVDNANKMNPFYDYFRVAGTGAETSRSQYTVATDYTIDYLKATNDPRMARLYAPSKKKTEFKGVWQALSLPGTGYTSDDLSKVGPGLIKSPTQDQPLMLYSEALLLQAEAAQRGYLSDNAEALYKKAIEQSFVFLGVPDAVASAQAYYSQDLPNVNFASSPNKIMAIMQQKWIALNGTSSIELWIEHNRTGYGAGIPIPADAGRTTRPYRLLYPSSEVARNSANVPAQTIEDAFNKKIFWQK